MSTAPVLPLADARPIAALTVGEFRELLREVRDEAQDSGAAAPALLNQAELARALGISTRTLRDLVLEGLPELRVASAPRYVLADVVVWLREQNRSAR